MEEHIEFSDDLKSSYISQALIAGQIAKTNILVKQIKSLSNENIMLKEKMKQLKESAKQVKILYENKCKENLSVNKSLLEKEAQLNLLRKKNSDLEHSQINSQLAHTQLIAELETKTCHCTSAKAMKNIDTIALEDCLKLFISFTKRIESNSLEVPSFISTKHNISLSSDSDDLDIGKQKEISEIEDLSTVKPLEISLDKNKECQENSQSTQPLDEKPHSETQDTDATEQKLDINLEINSIFQEMIFEIPRLLSPLQELETRGKENTNLT